MSRLKLVFTESLRSLGANVSTTLAATVTVLIGMFLLGLFIAFGTWVVSWSDHVKKELVVHVYFCTTESAGCTRDATQAQMSAVAREATASPLVKNVNFSESRFLQFRGETFNAFNHADFGLPGRAVGGPGFGIISDATDARVLQLGVRIVFYAARVGFGFKCQHRP